MTKYFPVTESDFENALDEMNTEWQFPFAFSALDGTHLPIKCPDGGQLAMKSYYNFKGFYSVIAMALVDAKGRFIWASVGRPGNTHDSLNFRSSHLFNRICQGEVIPRKVQRIDRVEIPPVILADGAFPFRTWIMKPYGHPVLTEEERYFSYRLSRARIVSEIAFGMLKS